jgi:hypothetical protein
MTAGVTEMAGGLTWGLGSYRVSAPLMSVGSKVCVAATVVTLPLTVHIIYKDISSDDPYRNAIGYENAVGLGIPAVSGLALYTEIVAPPAAEAATKVFSSATASDMSAIAGAPVTWIW